MTICIASICNLKEGINSPCIVFCADRLISSGMGISFEHGNPKVKWIPSRAIIMEAGDGTTSDLILDKEVLSEKNSEQDVKFIAELIENKIKKLKQKRIDGILSKFGLDKDKFISKSKEISENIYIRIINEIEKMDLGLQFIIAGLDKDATPHIFVVSDDEGMQCFDSLGFVAIGSGTPLSLLQITKSIHSNRISVSEAVTRVYSAKKNAERISGVGRLTDLGVIQLIDKKENDWVAAIYELGDEYKKKIDEELNKIAENEKTIFQKVKELLDKDIYPKEEEVISPQEQSPPSRI